MSALRFAGHRPDLKQRSLGGTEGYRGGPGSNVQCVTRGGGISLINVPDIDLELLDLIADHRRADD